MASSASPLRQRRAVGSETWPHYVAAIVVAVILTLFLKETGSAVRKAH